MEVKLYVLFRFSSLRKECLPDFDLKVLFKFATLCVIIIVCTVVNYTKCHLKTIFLCEEASVVVVVLQVGRSEQSSASLVQRDCLLLDEPQSEQQYDDGCARTGTRLEVTFLFGMIQSDGFCIHVELEELLRSRPAKHFVFTSFAFS